MGPFFGTEKVLFLNEFYFFSDFFKIIYTFWHSLFSPRKNLHPWCQFHQDFMSAFFVQKFIQSQNVSRKSCRNDIHTKNSYVKTLMKLTPVWCISSKDSYFSFDIQNCSYWAISTCLWITPSMAYQSARRLLQKNLSVVWEQLIRPGRKIKILRSLDSLTLVYCLMGSSIYTGCFFFWHVWRAHTLSMFPA